MKKPKVCVLRTAGINCDNETAFAFTQAGAQAQILHINSFIAKEDSLSNYHILAVPGGFSYGDDVGAGKILANELKYKLIDEVKKFIRDGKLIIGICNGFQVLVKSGLLPGNESLKQEASLIINDSGKFEDRWVYLKPGARSQEPGVNCVWSKDLPEIIYLPVAHGEGKFVGRTGKIVFQYCDEEGALAGYPDNPNGSEKNIAGICDDTGRILGLMPHPERHIEFWQHPRWTARKARQAGDGFLIFKNGVEYARKFL